MKRHVVRPAVLLEHPEFRFGPAAVRAQARSDLSYVSIDKNGVYGPDI